MPATDQGITTDRYTLVPRTLIFILRDDRVLLLRGAPHKRLWANRYNGVGGHIEQGEDVLEAARRELAEETGLSVPDLWLCGIITVDTGGRTGVGIFVFCGESEQGELIPAQEGTLEWVPLDRLDQLLLMEDLPFILEKIVAMRKGDIPFSAHSHYLADGKLVISFNQ